MFAYTHIKEITFGGVDTRVLLFLFIVCTCWYSNARELSSANQFTRKDESFSVLQTNNKLSEGEAQHLDEVSKNNELCTLCEDFASDALIYLSENKTQTEIISILHKSCSKIPTFKKQSISCVDLKSNRGIQSLRNVVTFVTKL
ncbi:uncharacterized protein LOC111398829 isoform X2 [Olea europaea var. sylvestris]|uniref:uncharacterized protein LOC111398829 isoform X2 n=1 Tax=Olea europaea var. sylvestris TaxID=158386 RepID=UPI000C1CFA15|nr:uncharacterized protein LOC111398829 isoform X2 [Olea europaea var. sylvestris]